MPGYGCAFCDMRYAHAGELISHLTTTCVASMWQDSDSAPDGYVAWTNSRAGGRFRDMNISDSFRDLREQYRAHAQVNMTRLRNFMYNTNVCKSPQFGNRAPHETTGTNPALTSGNASSSGSASTSETASASSVKEYCDDHLDVPTTDEIKPSVSNIKGRNMDNTPSDDE